MSDHLKKETLFWAKFIGVLVGGYGMYRGYGPVIAVCGLCAAYHIAVLHKTVKSHSVKIRELRRLP